MIYYLMISIVNCTVCLHSIRTLRRITSMPR